MNRSFSPMRFKRQFLPAGRLFRFLLPVLLAVLTLCLAFLLVDPVNSPNSDFFTFWLGGRLTLEGKNPYAAEVWIGGHHRYGATWIPNATFIYPQPVAILFMPLGALPLYPAYVLWAWITQGLILLSGLLLLRLWPASLTRPYLPLLGLTLLLFRPAWLVTAHGQLSGIVLFALSLVTFFWSRGRYSLGALFLPLLLVKPNLGGLLLIFFLGHRLLARDGKSVLAFLLSGLLALASGFLAQPDWLTQFLSAASNKMSQAFGSAPTLWGAATLLCSFRLDCSRRLGGGLVALTFIVFLLTAWKTSKGRLSPVQLTGAAICLTLLVTPYTWTYDQVLLLFPLTVAALALAEQGKKFFTIALLLLSLDGLAFLLSVVALTMGYEMIYVLLPLTSAIFFWKTALENAATSASI